MSISGDKWACRVELTEAEEGNVHGQPGEESTSGCQALEPGENGVSGGRDGKEGEEREAGSEEDSNVRKTFLGAFGQDDRSLPSQSQTVEDTGRGEQEGVTGREGGGENGCVDDMRQDLYSRVIECNHVRRLSSGSRRPEEVRIVVCNEHAGNQHTDEVEEHDPVENTLHGLGDVAPRVDGF